MPTVLRVDGFRFFFFSNEHTPEHIHIEKGDILSIETPGGGGWGKMNQGSNL